MTFEVIKYSQITDEICSSEANIRPITHARFFLVIDVQHRYVGPAMDEAKNNISIMLHQSSRTTLLSNKLI